MSKAVVFGKYGDADVLHITAADSPDPGPGQVRVRVRAVGIQPFDCLFRSGGAHQYVPASFPQRLGNEFAGIVAVLGNSVRILNR